MQQAKQVVVMALIVLLAFWAFGNAVLIVADLAWNEQPGMITFGCALNVIGCGLGVKHLAPVLEPGPSFASLEPEPSFEDKALGQGFTRQCGDPDCGHNGHLHRHRA